MTAILSFLGSAVFRWALEKFFGIVQQKTDHTHEIESLKVQGELEAARHVRNIEMLEIQGRLKLDLIEGETRGAVEVAEGQAFVESIKGAAKPTGILWIDGWNGAIRPFMATVCIAAWLWLLSVLVPPYVASLGPAEKIAAAVMLIEFTINLIASVIGWFFATRSLLPGKK
jgi:hypothetical protein